MSFKILVINGPNLNMLGEREPETYGQTTLKQIEQEVKGYAEERGLWLSFFQSNHEGEIIDKIHSALSNIDLLIINAGAFTHYSVAIHDALKAVNLPVIEVHMSNIFAREEFRHKSLIAPLAVGGVFGFGKDSYKLAVDAAVSYLNRHI